MYREQSDTDKPKLYVWDMASTDVRGDYTLSEIPDSVSEVPKGAVIYGDEDAGLAYIVKTATVLSGGSATKTRIPKNGMFVSGDFIAESVGGTSVAITSVDKSNDDYDVLNHGSIGATIAEDSVIFEASSAGPSAEYKYKATGLLGDDTENLGDASCTQVVRSLRVVEPNLPFPLTDEIKELLTSRIRYAKF